MKFEEILRGLEFIEITGPTGPAEVTNVSGSSNNISEGGLFVAIRGYKTDGHKYIQQAINNGASVIVYETEEALSGLTGPENLCFIRVDNSRIALGKIASVFYGSPSEKLKLAGITGTKGKTTTSYFLKSILENAGHKAGLIGTIENLVGNEVYPTKLTTPPSDEINRLMAMMNETGCMDCVMEVSSHASELDRTSCLDFDLGLFTNISSDHMDFHLNFENYLAAKKKFFLGLKPSAVALINRDDPSWEKIASGLKCILVTYGRALSADFRILDASFDINGTSLRVGHKNKIYDLRSSSIGLFNIYNSCAAFAAAVIMGLSPDEAKDGLENASQVPGRFELIRQKDKRVIIDYAHTEDSLRQALESVRSLVGNSRPVVCVMGCGGNRDRTKRPRMGLVASELADRVIVTTDNPRDEIPMDIISDVVAGIKGKNFDVVEDREDAIRMAILNSESNAVILIAGKGHESYQEINGIRHHFSDREIANGYLRQC